MAELSGVEAIMSEEEASVPIALRDEGAFEPRDETPKCPDCGTTDVVPWPPGRPADRTVSEDDDDPPLGPCRDCGVQLEDDGIRGLWD